MGLVSLLAGSLGISQAYLVLDEAEAPSVKDMASAASELTSVVGNNFVFKFNPLNYSISKRANWRSAPQASSTDAPGADFTGPDPRTMSIEIFLDDSWKPFIGSIQPQIDFLMKCCDPTPESIELGTPRPPLVRFGWGTNVGFKAYVESVNITVNLFSSSGEPTRGIANLTLVEVPDSLLRQNPTSGTPLPSRSHLVDTGDSLASIANKHYGNPNWWRAIATVNNIYDPERLTAGNVLLIPDDADARALA
ncbi:MAG: LysM peptidoglycan-binding domain-containing protein [Actinomycetota bacterium]|jgi:hypothetical protein|nr:LysM peptidoglycan-binding domain-containing protein [Actinomycetota bacterium]